MNSYAPEDCPSHQAALTRLAQSESPTSAEKIPADVLPEAAAPINIAGEAVLTPPAERPTLPRSGTLGIAEANTLMSARYINLVGIIGLPDAGKTACAASLYLLLARSSLKGFKYLRSRTLMALEEISRGTRRWNEGNPPQSMTNHTELPDDRRAGFLHLRLLREEDGRKFDLLLPDLPGEWSRNLINQGDDGRFGFLKAADVIWVMANGKEFITTKTREHALYQLSNLIERLQSVVTGSRIILVTSWHDSGTIADETIKRIHEDGKRFGFDIEFSPIASFSDSAVLPGTGLAELIEKTIAVPRMQAQLWPSDTSQRSNRAFLNFGQSK